MNDEQIKALAREASLKASRKLRIREKGGKCEVRSLDNCEVESITLLFQNTFADAIRMVIEELAAKLEAAEKDKKRIIQIRQNLINDLEECIKELKAGYNRADPDVRALGWDRERRELKKKLESAEKDTTRMDLMEKNKKEFYWTHNTPSRAFYGNLHINGSHATLRQAIDDFEQSENKKEKSPNDGSAEHVRDYLNDLKEG